VVYFTTQYLYYIVSKSRIIDKLWIWKDLEGIDFRGLIEVLSQRSSGKTEEAKKKYQDSWYPIRVPPDYKSRVLLVYQAVVFPVFNFKAEMWLVFSM
jgi:hypothetical protein